MDKTKDTLVVNHLQENQVPYFSPATFSYVDPLDFFDQVKFNLWLLKERQERVVKTEIELKAPARS